MNLRQFHRHNQRRRSTPRTTTSNMSSLHRYAVDHSRGRIVLRAATAEAAVERVKAMTPGSTGHYACALPTFNPATQVAQTPSTMTPKKKSETKKAASKAAPKKKTLGERVEKAASPKQQAKKAAAEGRAEGRRIADAANATGRPDQRRKPAKDGMSGLDAAAKVLAAEAGPLNAKEILAEIQKGGLAPGLTGKTPHATLYAGMITEISKKGKESRFKRGSQKGTFEFNETGA